MPKWQGQIEGKAEKKILFKTCRNNLHSSGPPKPGPPWARDRVRCIPWTPLSQALFWNNILGDSYSLEKTLSQTTKAHKLLLYSERV